MKKFYFVVLLTVLSTSNLFCTELTQAIVNKNVQEALNLIQESGKQNTQININESDESDDDLTPLMLACINQLFDVVAALVGHPNIEINLQNKNGITALMLAAGSGNAAIVTQLLSHRSINISLKDNDGHTTLWWGENSQNQEVINLINGSSSWCKLI